MRRAARHALLAYGYLRGRRYHQIEPNAASMGDGERGMRFIKGIHDNVKRFGDSTAPLKQVDDWVRGKERESAA